MNVRGCANGHQWTITAYYCPECGEEGAIYVCQNPPPEDRQCTYRRRQDQARCVLDRIHVGEHWA